MPHTGIVIDPRFLDHDTGRGHPERPQRIATLLEWLDAAEHRYTRLEPRFATGEELALVHDGAYVADVERTRNRPYFAFDADTPTSPRSYDTARLAAGGYLTLLDAIVAGQVDNGFAFVRPPGHHAERHQAMGFCLFNNVAVGAAYLRQRYGLERILIVDWDLHHGNGTQHMFERDPNVLFISSHQYPFYPGTGAIEESGRGDGEGYTVNLALPGGAGDSVLVDAFRRIVLPIAHRYEPQFVLISAGFDGHQRDPLGDLQLTTAGYRSLTRALLDVAAQHAGGRCAAILEGGYDLLAIRDSSAAVLDELVQGASDERHGDAPPPSATLPDCDLDPVVDAMAARQRRYWQL